MSDIDVLDAAYERLAGFDFEYGGGLADHGPMVAEALVRLDRATIVPAWVEQYSRRLEPRRPPVAPLDHWRASLGDEARATDWVTLFTRELDQRRWIDVLQTWAPRLVPGVFAAATHGVIRTAHAVRAIAEIDTPARRGELTRGLAHWASSYQELPGRPHPTGTTPIGDALDDLARSAVEAPRRLISVAVAHRVRHDARFATVVDSLAPPTSANDGLLALTAAGSEVYLQNASAHPIAYIHAVTGPAAARLLLPYLPDSDRAMVFAYTWQVVAGMVATYGNARAPHGDASESIDDIIDRAVGGGDEHAIKMTEACLREHRDNPRPEYLAAALDVSARLRA